MQTDIAGEKQGGFEMLNFTIKPGESFQIGKDITVVFLGGTPNNLKVMVDAPRSYNIVRGSLLEKQNIKQKNYYPEPAIPAEAMRKMIAKQKQEKRQMEG